MRSRAASAANESDERPCSRPRGPQADVRGPSFQANRESDQGRSAEVLNPILRALVRILLGREIGGLGGPELAGDPRELEELQELRDYFEGSEVDPGGSLLEVNCRRTRRLDQFEEGFYGPLDEEADGNC